MDMATKWRMTSTPFKNLFFQNKWTDFHELWYAGEGNWFHFCLSIWSITDNVPLSLDQHHLDIKKMVNWKIDLPFAIKFWILAFENEKQTLFVLFDICMLWYLLLKCWFTVVYLNKIPYGFMFYDDPGLKLELDLFYSRFKCGLFVTSYKEKSVCMDTGQRARKTTR